MSSLPDTATDAVSYLPDGSMQAVFDSALTGFFLVGNTWVHCPHQAPQIASWLCLFQGSWDYLCLMADIANDGDVGSEAYALCSLVRTKAAPFANVDCQLLLYTGVLYCTQTAALEQCLVGLLVREQVPDIYDRAALEFKELWSANKVSREEYHWLISKLWAECLVVVSNREPLEKKPRVGAVPRPVQRSCSTCEDNYFSDTKDDICEAQ
ncbi:hypothetical protein EDB83DRAFT_2312085 [Lactarius deliciosus]|nr:hypothetical protein EDB83DRAFT_2312085 [Lactarius deliciosus]